MREIEAAPIVLDVSLVRRFWLKVEKTAGCWLWNGKRDRKGYGRLYLGGGRAKPREGFAHRVSYAIHFGPPPTDRAVLHTCDTPACVRPDHFFLGTQLDNLRDMDAKGRRVSKPRVDSCIYGHDLTGDNAIERPDGRGRHCHECQRRCGREYRRKLRERDPEGVRARKRVWGAANRDKVAAMNQRARHKLSR